MPVVEISWWQEKEGVSCGRLTGRVKSAGCRWRQAAEKEVWLWLNREGSGLIWGKGERFVLKPGMYAMTGGGEYEEWTCVRYPGAHQVELVKLSREWLAEHLGRQPAWLHPDMARWLAQGGRLAFCGLMGQWEKDLCQTLQNGAEEGGAEAMLAEAKLLEWATVRLFRSRSGDAGAGFCSSVRQRDPVRQALDVMLSRLDQPLELEALAREVGLTPNQLSRRVSSETGMPLQRHLRRMRIERACQQLLSGRNSLTEIAQKIGYPNLSRFTQAFLEETGQVPQDWLRTNTKQSLSGKLLS